MGSTLWVLPYGFCCRDESYCWTECVGLHGETTRVGSLVTRVGPHTVHGCFCGFCFRPYAESSYCHGYLCGFCFRPYVESSYSVHGYPYTVHGWNPWNPLIPIGILLHGGTLLYYPWFPPWILLYYPWLSLVTPVGSVSGPVTEAKTEATLCWPCQQILAP